MEKKYDPDKECELVINKLQLICEKRKISHYVLAKNAEISTSTLYDLLKGKTKPYLYTMYKLCNALDVSIEEVLQSENEKNGLSMQEKTLLTLYHSLPDYKKELLLIMADMIQQYER